MAFWRSCWPSVWCSVSCGSAGGSDARPVSFRFWLGASFLVASVDVAWGGASCREREVLDGLLVSLVGLGGQGVVLGVGVVAGLLANIPCLTVVDTKHG